MAERSIEGTFPATIDHPTAGTSTLDPSRVAIRWRDRVTDELRAALLVEVALTPATLGDRQRPSFEVNHTAGLWWVQSARGPIPVATLEALEASDLVAWVSPAYQAGDGSDDGTRYAVNPTVLFVRRQSLDAIGGLQALGSGVVADPSRASRIPGLVAIRVEQPSAADGRTALQIATRLTTAGRVAVRFENIPYVSPTACANRTCRPPTGEFTPNDPLFAIQWGLHRVGATRAWAIARGSADVTVAVIDEGVELGHPDLDVHPQSWNASSDTPDGSPTGDHGTACAGIAGARLDNAQGVAGLGGGVRVMAIATSTWADIDIAEGLYFAADNGARVVSMSFGVYPSWNFWDFDLIRDALQHAHDAGIVLVAATGNEDIPESRFPGSDARTIGVGGSNRDDQRKRIGDASSEAWWGACYGPDVDVVAPCLEIATTDRLGGAGYDAGDYFDRFNGTSAATPFVAGLAGLILSLRPTLSNVEVRTVIESTTDKISPSMYSYALVGTKPNGTWNEEVGYGRINAERAILSACAEEHGERGDCHGCGGECSEHTPQECRGPVPVPWVPYDRCMLFYESRFFNADPQFDRGRLLVRVSYEHCLRLIGRQQGPLLYTTTLLPSERLDLYEFDRYRRVRSETERVSVHSSFRQTLSALSQTRRAASASAYLATLTDVRSHADTSVSAGGGLAGFFGAPTASGEFGVTAETTVASGSSVQTAAEQFSQIAATSAQATEAERSLVISRYEEAENVNTTRRTLRNDNACYAVTYYVRRVNEVYETRTRIVVVEWRLGDGAWRLLDDLAGVPDDVRDVLKKITGELPREGDEVRNPRQITLPTDGTVYEPELAHCSSCEPHRDEAMRIELEHARLRARRACLETELLALELERRKALATAAAVPLELGQWPLERVGTTAVVEHQ